MNKNHDCFLSKRGVNSPWILTLTVSDRYDNTVTEIAKIAKSSVGNGGEATIRGERLVLHGELGCCFFRIPAECVDVAENFVREFKRIKGHGNKSRLDVVNGRYVLVIKKS